MLLEKVRIFETMSLICYFVICKKNSSGTKSGSLILDKFTKFCIQEKRSKQQVQTLAQITRITHTQQEIVIGVVICLDKTVIRNSGIP